MFEYILFWIYFKVNFDNWTFTNFLQSVWSLQISPYEIRLPVKKHVPPSTIKAFPRRLCGPCGIIVSPTTLRRMISTQKGDCMYVLCGRKEEGARGNSFLSAKYSYAYVHTASLKIVVLLPRTTKTFPRRNISATLAINFVCCSS